MELLLKGCEKLGIELSDKQVKQVEDYSQELKKWNKAINLTSITTDKDIVVMHFLDSFTVYKHIKNESLVDVGSGGGFPGLALSILKPELPIYSVDSVAKKISFQTRVRSIIGAKNVFPIAARIEDFKEITPSQVISRAFTSLDGFFSLSKLETFKQSQFLAMKSKLAENEFEQSEYKKDAIIDRLKVPYLDADRYLITYG